MADLNKSEESKDGSEDKGTPRELTDDELKLVSFISKLCSCAGVHA